MESFIQPALFTKAPYEELDYTADYTDELTALGDTIVSSNWVVPTKDTDSIENTKLTLANGVACAYDEPSPVFSLGGTSKTSYSATVILAGGTLGRQYRVQNNIVTANGRRYSRQLLLTIAYR